MPEEEESGYFARIGNLREKVRVERQARILDRDVNPLQGMDLSSVRDVLGAACGTGSWLIQYALQHPESRIVGLDIDEGMLEYAKAKAHVAGVNVDFQIADILKPLDFPDASFDLIHQRMAMGFMHRSAWLHVLGEYMRVLRPGGMVILIEVADSATNDYLFDQFNLMVYRAFHTVGYTFAGDARQTHLCLHIALKRLLEETGFTNVAHQSFDIDFSSGRDAHAPVLENIAASYENGAPFFVKYGGAKPEQVNDASTYLHSLVNKSDFLGFWHFLSVIGHKP